MIKFSKILKLLMILSLTITVNANAEVISITANSTPPANCKEGELYDIYSYHEINIINASNYPETMEYSYQLCMEGICDNAQNIITVYPKQSWVNSHISHLRVRMAKGKHIYIVRTECGKEKKVNDYTINVS